MQDGNGHYSYLNGVVRDLLRSSYLKASVKLVFAVGFAWGAKPASRGGNQLIGDVIVATKVVEAGYSRTTTPATRSQTVRLAAASAAAVAITAIAVVSAMAAAVLMVALVVVLAVTTTHAGKDDFPKDELRGAVQLTTLAKSVNSLLCEGWPDASQTHFGRERITEHPRRPM